VDNLSKHGILAKRGAGGKVYEVTQCSSKNCAEYELCVIEEDMINDVARFMNPGKLVKRTSKRHNFNSSHHQAMINRTLKEMIIKGGCKNLPKFERNDECENDVNAFGSKS
jgi:CRISPR/Cas system-associated protein Cas7 (RAMP superfamily)